MRYDLIYHYDHKTRCPNNNSCLKYPERNINSAVRDNYIVVESIRLVKQKRRNKPQGRTGSGTDSPPQQRKQDKQDDCIRAKSTGAAARLPRQNADAYSLGPIYFSLKDAVLPISSSMRRS